MILLSLDSSAKSASVAVFNNDKLISECFVNTALTHSCTLLPMADNALKQANLKIDDVDLFAVNNGPGSFTGIRIGVAALKGLAFKNNKPCAAVSTLECMAYNFVDEDCIICSVMDARCNQVYNAFFKCENGEITRLSQDDALSIDDLFSLLQKYNEKIYLVGDGAELCFKACSGKLQNVILPAENRRYQRAFGTALAALHNSEFNDSSLLMPTYLRPPQAERELKLKHPEVKL